MNRRNFIKQGSLVSLGFMGLQAFVSSCGYRKNPLGSFPTVLSEGYGPLINDPKGIINLPKDFSYKIISRMGDLMSDGLYVPGDPDGMATFPGSSGQIIIIRNHELAPSEVTKGAFGAEMELLDKIPSTKFYDYGSGETPCLGGTTTLVYDLAKQEIITQYLSLVGTVRNCAGGPTPWGTWISCEENVFNADDLLNKNHGYAFEVPAQATPLLSDSIPLTEMGRFCREAVCVDPRTSIVYQTEDLGDGLIYRFLPHSPGELLKGGQLQVLSLKDVLSFDTRNWEESQMEIGKKHEVIWLDIDDVESPDDDQRLRGFDKGAARFARGEGAWFGNNEAYFACTNGGKEKLGQIFRYTPSLKEGQPEENDHPSLLELMVEPNNGDIVRNCDNITIDANGHIVLCEDTGSSRITPNRAIYHIAENVGVKSEFAGSCFFPNGDTMFVNIQGPGLTLAIQGPWHKAMKF